MQVLLIVIFLLLVVTCLCVANEEEQENMLKRWISSIENCNYVDTLTQACSATETKLIFKLTAFQL